MPLNVKIGNVYETVDMKDLKPKKEISNCFSTLNVPTDSVENTIKALELLGIEAYGIYDENRKRLHTSEMLRQHEENERRQDEEHDIKMLALLEEFKAQPAVLQKWDFKTTRIQLEKGEDPKYNRTKSSGLSAYVHLQAYQLKAGGENGEKISVPLWAYVSKDGKALKKKYLKDYASRQEDAEAVVMAIPSILKAQENAERKYNIRR